jgi:hypothetical protein
MKLEDIMKKVVVAALVSALSLSTAAYAKGHSAADNGKGDGKGRTGIASAVSSGNAKTDDGKGAASVASGLNGGWGSVGGVSNGKAATPKE